MRVLVASCLGYIGSCLSNYLGTKKEVFLTKRKGDQPVLVCNIEKAKKRLKWKLRFSKIENIFKDEIKWSKFFIKKKFIRKYLSVQK